MKEDYPPGISTVGLQKRKKTVFRPRTHTNDNIIQQSELLIVNVTICGKSYCGKWKHESRRNKQHSSAVCNHYYLGKWVYSPSNEFSSGTCLGARYGRIHTSLAPIPCISCVHSYHRLKQTREMYVSHAQGGAEWCIVVERKIYMHIWGLGFVSRTKRRHNGRKSNCWACRCGLSNHGASGSGVQTQHRKRIHRKKKRTQKKKWVSK